MMKRIILTLCCLAVIGCTTHTEPDQPAGNEKRSASYVVNVVLPLPKDISGFRADPVHAGSHWPEFKIDRKAFSKILTDWHQVSYEHWQHGYSHVGNEDRTGTIELHDGSTARWMVRPGGLAILSLPNGHTVYLARELTKWSGIGEPMLLPESSK